MRSNFFISLASLMCMMVISCTNEDYIGTENTSLNSDLGTEVILQKRKLSLPSVVKTKGIQFSKNLSRATNENGAYIGNSDQFLGYSYRIGNSILGDFENVGDKVIDIDKVRLLPSSYITPKALQKYASESFSYSSYDSYVEKLSETKKVDTGFQLNLGLFKIGRKKTTNEVFKSYTFSSNRAVYGELNMLYKNSSFNLQVSDGAKRQYSQECLSSTFVKNLYTSPISNIIDTYGAFILSGYVTGGKAFAMFAGETKKDVSATEKTLNMDKSITASFSWGKDSVSGDFKFGKGNFRSDSTAYGMHKLYTRLWIYGGKPEGVGMNSADNLESIDFNLSTWVSSLSDVNTHTIIDLTEKGLTPLSDVVLEKNYKKRIEYLLNGVVNERPVLTIPKITIMRVFERYSASGTALYDIAPVLITRQGDYIVLRSGDAANQTDSELLLNENANVFAQKARAIADEKSMRYELEINYNSATRLNPLVSSSKYVCVDLKKIKETSMRVFTNERTGVQYIYDTVNRVAFSHYIDVLDEDWILDEYGIRDWVESLPTRKISMATLASSYQVIGL